MPRIKLPDEINRVTLAFDPADLSFSRVNALYLANASSIAYCRAPRLAAHESLGLKAVAFKHKITRMRGFLGVCDTHAVLAFRGTDPVTLPNWLTDAVVKLVKCSEYDGRVHHGFSTALKHSWRDLEAVLDQARGKPLYVTGHSMGGALAVLAACRLAKAACAPAATYTFGAPRVGDADFCASYLLPTYRVVHGLDLVPEMPLPSVAGLIPERSRFASEKVFKRVRDAIDRVPSYGHVNTFVYVDRDGAVIQDADVESWHAHAVTRAISTRGRSFLEGVSDHLISSYIRGLEGRVGKSPGLLRRKPQPGCVAET